MRIHRQEAVQPVPKQASKRMKPSVPAQREVPDYLRGSEEIEEPPKTSLGRLALTVVAAFLLVFAAIQAFGWVTGSHPLASLFGSNGDTEITTNVTEGESAGGGSTELMPANEGIAAGTGDLASGANVAVDAAPDLVPSQDQPSGNVAGDTTSTVAPSLQSPPTAFSRVGPESTISDGQPTAPPADGNTLPEATNPGGQSPTIDPPTGPPADSGDAATGPGVTGTEVAAVTAPGVGNIDDKEVLPGDMPVDPAADVAATDGADGTAAPLAVGHHLSDKQMLLRHAEDGTWRLVPTRSELYSTDMLLNLPPCRSQIVLRPGIHVYFAGASKMQLSAPQEDGSPVVGFNYGRLMAQTVTGANSQLHIVLGQQSGTIHFRDDNSAIAIERQPYLSPGASPLDAQPIMVTQLYVTSGQIQWTAHVPEGAEPAEPVVLSTGDARVLIDGQEDRGFSGVVLPEWIRETELNFLDQGAWAKLAPLLESDRPIGLMLLEQIAHKQTDVRSLAVRCLSYLDQYDPFFENEGALNHLSQRASWGMHLDALRHGVARGPESARAVLASIRKNRASDADVLWQLVLGFSPDRLEKDGAGVLVENLDHGWLDVRVLAHENLKRITGKPLGYRPEYTEGVRKTYVRQWRDRLAAQEIVYRDVPSPVPAIETATDP